MLIFVEVEATEASFKMALFFPFKGSKGWRVLSVYTLGEFWVPIFKFKSSLKTSAIASNAVIVEVREAPCTTGRSSKGQLQQQRAM